MTLSARRISTAALALVVTAGLGITGAGGADAEAPVQRAEAAGIPLPHDDPFYKYDGAAPLGASLPGPCSRPAR